jgi:hypothetical protein
MDTMASQKGKLKVLGLFAFGFLAGSILFGGLIAWRYSVMFRDQYYLRILDVTNTAFMIRAGREEELVKNAEASIRQSVATAYSLWGDNKARLGSFWYAQRYYHQFGIDVPADIQPILNNLPSRPLTSCEKRKIQKEETEPNDAE